VKFDLGLSESTLTLIFPFKRCEKARFQVFFSKVSGFRVEDQGLSFLYGGNSKRLQGLLGRRRPRGTASLQLPCKTYLATCIKRSEGRETSWK
jgi:hypothetical protein